MLLVISLIYNRKNTGPRTEPFFVVVVVGGKTATTTKKGLRNP